MSGLILYTTEDGASRIQLRADGLETAELRAKRRQDIPMRFWMENVGQIIASNGFALLEGADTVSREQMEAGTDARWLSFDEQRKKEEARAADEAELAALEHRINRCKKP